MGLLSYSRYFATTFWRKLTVNTLARGGWLKFCTEPKFEIFWAVNENFTEVLTGCFAYDLQSQKISASFINLVFVDILETEE